MDIKSRLRLTGRLSLCVYDGDHKLLHSFNSKNLIVDVGLNKVIDFIAAGAIAAPITHIAIGDNPSSLDVTNTALLNELFRAASTASVSSNTIRHQTTWLPGTAVGTYREAGLFDSALGGDMFSRIVFADVAVDSTNYLVATWDITVSGA